MRLRRLGYTAFGAISASLVTAVLSVASVSSIASVAVAAAESSTEAAGPGQVVAAYMPEYRWYIDVEQAAQSLTDLILFSMTPTASGSLDTHWIPPANLVRARKAADAAPHVMNVLICVGGAGRSQHFPAVAADKTKRRTFIKSLVALIAKYERTTKRRNLFPLSHSHPNPSFLVSLSVTECDARSLSLTCSLLSPAGTS